MSQEGKRVSAAQDALAASIARQREAATSGERRIGDYRIVREIGRGGMGIVYEAEELGLKRRVALKLLPEHHSTDPERVERFVREAQSLARVGGPHVVTIYAASEVDGIPFLAMELIEGESLADRLERVGSLPVAERHASSFGAASRGDTYEEACVHVVLGILAGVEAIHAEGIVHRDLKPANVLISRQGQLLIADFGLAKDLAERTGLTSLGQPRGSPLYMSPEQASGNLMGIDLRSDLFSVGVILYELLAGMTPFRGETWSEIARSIITTRPPPVREKNPRVSEDLAKILDKALEKDFEHRYASAREVADDLRRVLAGEPIVHGQASLGDRWRRTLSAQSVWTRRALTAAKVWGLGGILCFAMAHFLDVRSPPDPDFGQSGTDYVLWAVSFASYVAFLVGNAFLIAALFDRGRPKGMPTALFLGLSVLYYVLMLVALAPVVGDGAVGL